MLSGHVDKYDLTAIEGWAWDTENPEKRVEVAIYDGDALIHRLVASELRLDLARAGVGDGHYGFRLKLPPDLLSLSAHRLSVRYAETGEHLRNSPRVLYSTHGGTFESFQSWVDTRIDDLAAAAAEPADLAACFALGVNMLSKLLAAESRMLEQRGDTGSVTMFDHALPSRLKFVLERAMERLTPLHVPAYKAPALSIIISARAALGDIHALIRSILASDGLRDFEIVLVDVSGGSDLVLLPFLIKGGIRYVKTPRKGTDFEAYALGLPLARGQDLLFLSGVATLDPAAIGALRQALDNLDGKVIVGTRLLSVDGRIVEAGSNLDTFGQRLAIGRHDTKDVPRYRILKRSDDVSPRAFAIRRALLAKMGDFTAFEAFDDLTMTDFCLQVLSAGYGVVVQGYADAVVTESEPAQKIGSMSRRNFIRKWQGRIPQGFGLRKPEPPKRALLIDERWPDAGRDAASSAILSHGESLLRLGYQVEFIASAPQPPTQEDGAHLFTRGILPHLAQQDVGGLLKSRSDQFAVVYLHRPSALKSYLETIRATQKEALVVYNVADLHFLRLRRQAEIEGNAALLAESAIMEQQEKHGLMAVDAVITHSNEELALIRQALPGVHAERVLWNHRPAENPADFNTRSNFAFLGSYLHAPNVDAVNHFCRALWPKVLAAVPASVFEVAGTHLEAAGFENFGPNVHWRGYVADVAAYLREKRVMLAPLRFGAGVKGKILLALAQGIPCVMSEVGAEGMGLPERLRHLLVAPDDEAFVAKAVRLHTVEADWNEASALGIAWARDNLSTEAIDTQMLAALARPLGASGRPSMPQEAETAPPIVEPPPNEGSSGQGARLV